MQIYVETEAAGSLCTLEEGEEFDMIKISVIIPVYNCEKLLPHCLDSICGQTIDKSLLEVILVDDHSSDGSYEICKEYEKHYPYIHAFTRAVNSRGCSAPRNNGLEHARGEYILLADADDWLGSDALRRLLYHAERTGSDYMAGRAVEVNRLRRKGITKWMRSNTAEYAELDFSTSFDLSESFTCWSRLVKRSLLVDNDIKFAEDVIYYEDYLWSVQVLHHAEHIYMENDYDYYYLRRDRGVPSMVMSKGLIYNKRPENLYHSLDKMISIVESYGYDPDHAVWKKIFLGQVRFVLQHIDKAAEIEPETYPEAGHMYKQMVWNRVRKHYSPWVKENIPLDLVCWFDAIEAGLGFAMDNDPIRYYAEVRLNEKRIQEAIEALTACDIALLPMPAFLSEEARIRLIATQAVGCEFYSNPDCDTSDSKISGEYRIPLKVTEGFTFRMELQNKPMELLQEIVLKPGIWGEAYQETGLWSARSDGADIESLDDIEIAVYLQGKCITRRKALPWDDSFGRPVKIDRVHEKLKKCQKQLKETQGKLKKANNKIRTMENSRSWKITRPLRRMRGH